MQANAPKQHERMLHVSLKPKAMAKSLALTLVVWPHKQENHNFHSPITFLSSLPNLDWLRFSKQLPSTFNLTTPFYGGIQRTMRNIRASLVNDIKYMHNRFKKVVYSTDSVPYSPLLIREDHFISCSPYKPNYHNKSLPWSVSLTNCKNQSW